MKIHALEYYTSGLVGSSYKGTLEVLCIEIGKRKKL